jgi:hypothetical protein
VYVGLSLFFTLLGFPNECLLGFLQGSIVGGLVGLVGVGLLPEWGVSFAMGFASVFLLLFLGGWGGGIPVGWHGDGKGEILGSWLLGLGMGMEMGSMRLLRMYAENGDAK